MRRGRHQRGEPAIALLEAAFHLLRSAPAGSWLPYYLGTVPWILALLAYGGEMAGPGRFGAGGALALAAGYLWMKTGQSVFARGLLTRLGAAPAVAPKHLESGPPDAAGAPPPSGRWAQTFLRQAAVQPWSLLALPVAFVIGLPFGWVYAYFQSFLILGDHAAARRHAALWPRQNHAVLVLLAAVALCVFLNAGITIIALPGLLAGLFGIDSAAARNPWGLVSWTTAAMAAALTYLAIGPLAKAVYALRCFHGEARHSGEDLRTELRGRRGPAGRSGAVAAGIATLLLMAAAAAAHPPGAASPAGANQVPADSRAVAIEPAQVPGTSPDADAAGGSVAESAAELDRALDRVLGRPEFAWRLPRVEDPAAEELGFFAAFVDTLSRWTRAALDRLDRLISWLRRQWRPATGSGGEGGFGWIGSTYLWLAVLAFALLVAAVLLVRHRRRPAPAAAVATTPVRLDPLADASTAAAAAPEKWLARADELLRAGDGRHAVRALYLASLSLLAHRELLQPERSKSNRDYLIELRRRARERPQLGELFSASSEAFERVWYGHHPATADLVAWFHSQHGQLAAHAS